MTDYLIRLNRVPNDIPRDVLIEHLAVAVRKIQKGRKALKRVGIQIIDVTNDKPKGRQHPFDGPEVNDDEPEGLARGGYIQPGTASTSMVAGDAGYIFSKHDLEKMGLSKNAVDTLRNLAQGTPIFSGKADDQGYDTTIKGTLPSVPEEYETVEVEIDLDGIISDVYRAIGEDFPYLAELFKDKREERELKRGKDATEPPAEGDWELDTEDRTGEDL